MTVQEWFEQGQDFYSGVMLLRSRGKDTSYYDRYLEVAVPPQYNALRLADDINALPITYNKVSDVSKTSDTYLPNPKYTFSPVETDPPVIALLRADAKRWHKVEGDNHARLHLATTQEARADIATERMTIIAPALDNIYNQIRTWQDSGELPNVPDNVVKSEKATLNELWREKLSIEPRLSKIKGQAKYQDEILEKFERLKIIHVELDLPFEKKITDYI
jgi:hypothetical protein